MKIKITPLTNKQEQLEGVFRAGNNFYYGKYHSAGIITEVREDDDWLAQEMSWVSRSEIPFITALRHSQITMGDMGVHLVPGGTPFIKKYSPFFKVEDVGEFPSNKECTDLIQEYCSVITDDSYHFYSRDVSNEDVIKLYGLFDYENDLLVRGGSCIYKAYILLNTSHTFAEEIYLNAFTAFESIVEFLKLEEGLKREEIVERVGKLKNLDNFKDYEEEMRDSIRNDIAHPYRDKFKEAVAKPFIIADFVYEDVALIDWIFKQLLLGNL